MDDSRKTAKEAAWCRACRGRNLSPVGSSAGFDLLRCADCRTVVVDPYPSDAELMKFYNTETKTGSYLGKKRSKLRRSLRRVRRILQQGVPGKKFLDIGCSVGYIVEAAHQLGMEARGIDIDAGAIEAARENFGSSGSFEAVSVQELAKRDGRFDAIYMSEVIEHVRDPEEMIRLASGLLNPGGLLYITAPDAGHFGVPRNFVRWDMVCPPQHLTYFTRKGMTQLLGRHGLKIERFQWALKPGMKAFARKVGS